MIVSFESKLSKQEKVITNILVCYLRLVIVYHAWRLRLERITFMGWKMVLGFVFVFCFLF